MKIQSGTQDLVSLPIIYHKLNFPWIAFQTTLNKDWIFCFPHISSRWSGNEWNGSSWRMPNSTRRGSGTDLTNIRASKSDCAQWAIFHAFPPSQYFITVVRCTGINICPVIICFQSAIHILSSTSFPFSIASLNLIEAKWSNLCGQKDLANKSNIWCKVFPRILKRQHEALKSPIFPDEREKIKIWSKTLIPFPRFRVI